MSSPSRVPSTAHIVYCEGRVILDRGPYASWQDVEREYVDYTTSLGAWTAQEIIDFFEDDFGEDDTTWPFQRGQIETFFGSKEKTLEAHRDGPPIDISFDDP
jgi:hypothetical protein